MSRQHCKIIHKMTDYVLDYVYMLLLASNRRRVNVCAATLASLDTQRTRHMSTDGGMWGALGRRCSCGAPGRGWSRWSSSSSSVLLSTDANRNKEASLLRILVNRSAASENQAELSMFNTSTLSRPICQPAGSLPLCLAHALSSAGFLIMSSLLKSCVSYNEREISRARRLHL